MTSEKNRLIKDICQKGVWSKPKFVEVKMVKMSLNCLVFFYVTLRNSGKSFCRINGDTYSLNGSCKIHGNSKDNINLNHKKVNIYKLRIYLIYLISTDERPSATKLISLEKANLKCGSCEIVDKIK